MYRLRLPFILAAVASISVSCGKAEEPLGSIEDQTQIASGKAGAGAPHAVQSDWNRGHFLSFDPVAESEWVLGLIEEKFDKSGIEEYLRVTGRVSASSIASPYDLGNELLKISVELRSDINGLFRVTATLSDSSDNELVIARLPYQPLATQHSPYIEINRGMTTQSLLVDMDDSLIVASKAGLFLSLEVSLIRMEGYFGAQSSSQIVEIASTGHPTFVAKFKLPEFK